MPEEWNSIYRFMYCKCARVNCANVAGHIEEDSVESDDESIIEDFNVN